MASTVASVLALRPRPVAVDVGRVRRGPLEVAVEESGMTRAKDRYVISAPASGALSRVALEPGDSVNEGDALAEIAPVVSPLLDERSRAEAEARLGAALATQSQAKAQAARATAAKQLAESELARVAKLADAGSISPREREQAEFEARMRGEELASAQFATKVATEEVRVAGAALAREPRGAGAARDRHVEVLAPVSGRVLRVHHKSASVVQAGTRLVEVGDPAALEVVVDLLTTDAVHVQPGTPVELLAWAAAARSPAECGSWSRRGSRVRRRSASTSSAST